MMVSSLQYACPVSDLARSLLNVWLSGDRYRLRLELDRVTQMPISAEPDEEWDRVELLKSLAQRMREASDLFTPRSESPRIGVWLDLLHHFAASDSSVS